MNRRTVLAAGAALTLTTVSGAYAAHQLLYHPFDGLPDPSGRTWKADFPFQGEVKCYAVDGTMIGSFGHGGSSDGSKVNAVVAVDGKRFTVKGEGRHEVRDEGTGALLGYADLTPETDEERARLSSEHDKMYGIEEPLTHISYGCDDGYGTAIGFFGDRSDKVHYISWRLRGVGILRFRRVDDGKIAYTGRATPVTPEVVAEQRRSMTPERFADLVLPNPPRVPDFEWTVDGRTYREPLTRPIRLTMPDGTRVTVEIGPLN